MGSLRKVAAVLGATIALTAAGCGGEDSGPGNASQAGGTADLVGQEITVAGFGGANTDNYVRTWYQPFEKATGAVVNSVDPVNYAKIRAQVESGNIQWDIVNTDTFFQSAHCGELFEPVDTSKLLAAGIAKEYIGNECSFPFPVGAIMMVYDAERFGDDPPKGWADFFDLKRYPGKRGIWNFAQNGSLEAALLADGVLREELYPLDVDRAFRKLDTIKNEIMWATTLSQTTDQLVNGQVVMSMTFTSRAGLAAQEGAPIAPVYENEIRLWDSWGILKGSQHKAAAEAFLNFFAQPEPQEAYLEDTFTAPTNPKADPTLSALQKRYSPLHPKTEQSVVNLDQRFWGDNFEEVNRRYVDWQTG